MTELKAALNAAEVAALLAELAVPSGHPSPGSLAELEAWIAAGRFDEARQGLEAWLADPERDDTQREAAAFLLERCLVSQFSDPLGTRHRPGTRRQMRLSTHWLAWLRERGIKAKPALDDEACTTRIHFSYAHGEAASEPVALDFVCDIDESAALLRLRCELHPARLEGLPEDGLLEWINRVNLTLPFGVLVFDAKVGRVYHQCKYRFESATCFPTQLEAIFRSSLAVAGAMQSFLSDLASGQPLSVPDFSMLPSGRSVNTLLEVVSTAQRRYCIFEEFQIDQVAGRARGVLSREVHPLCGEAGPIYVWRGEFQADAERGYLGLKLRLDDFVVDRGMMPRMLELLNEYNRSSLSCEMCLEPETGTVLVRHGLSVIDTAVLPSLIYALVSPEALSWRVPLQRPLMPFILAMGARHHTRSAIQHRE